MVTVLGLVGAARRWGNSEVAVREALLGAMDEGAKGEILRLTDLHIEPCTGCLRCAIKGEPCPLEDDMEWFLSRVRAAEALLLAAPTYFFGLPAMVKLLLDRLLIMTNYLEEGRKPGATITLYGREGWRGVTQPFLNAMAMGLGFRLVDSAHFLSTGPGELLLDEGALQRIRELGRGLARGERREPPPGVCPVCYSDFFLLEGERAICPICAAEAIISMEGGKVRLAFDLESQEVSRLTHTGQKEHLEGWIRPSASRFLSHHREIKERRERYQEMGQIWVEIPK